MSARDVMNRVRNNPRSIVGHLVSSYKLAKVYRVCLVHGIHGAARWRKGVKRGTNAARRREGKEEIRRQMDGSEESEPVARW